MSEQLNLFGSELKKEKDTIVCRHCKKEKPLMMFRLYRRATGDHRQSRSTSCKECQKSHSKVVDKIRKTAPPQTTYCAICNKQDIKTVLDHCYETETFRGWLCHHCNLAIGLLGDDVEGLTKALKYVKKELLKY